MGKQPLNAGLFVGWWLDPTNLNHKVKRIRRDEYPELYRLYRKHTAIRLGINTVGSRAPWHG